MGLEPCFIYTVYEDPEKRSGGRGGRRVKTELASSHDMLCAGVTDDLLG